MTEARRRIQEYRSLWLLLILVAGTAAALISSCGSDGGSSNGALCEQCGDSPDGPCQPTFELAPGPDEPPPCDDASLPNPCTVELICRRKSDSAQRRCFPKDPKTGDVNYQYRCDGSRPGGTAVPVITPTPTATPATTAVPQTCGNGISEGTEECDITDLNGESCGSQGCQFPGGILSCRVTCVFNYDLCTDNGTGCGN
jgi:hypothetical protein